MPESTVQNIVRPRMVDVKLLKQLQKGESQKRFYNMVTGALELGIDDFGVYEFLDRRLFNALEMELKVINDPNSWKLGNVAQYVLSLIWRIQMGTSTINQICDEKDTSGTPRLLREPGDFFIAGGGVNERLRTECDIIPLEDIRTRALNFKAFVVFPPYK